MLDALRQHQVDPRHGVWVRWDEEVAQPIVRSALGIDAAVGPLEQARRLLDPPDRRERLAEA
jgi:hypothetical protein